ncbi:unnamed protein product [Phytophthora lilii]|uniref:Unnamed protein product n=1 Tax=Phytophthora lilii TaxID=2077276 RepID=A0A9W6TRR8_9STRA|nr:unnamed protein product [Phytophthora lilii]
MFIDSALAGTVSINTVCADRNAYDATDGTRAPMKMSMQLIGCGVDEDHPVIVEVPSGEPAQLAGDEIIIQESTNTTETHRHELELCRRRGQLIKANCATYIRADPR